MEVKDKVQSKTLCTIDNFVLDNPETMNSFVLEVSIVLPILKVAEVSTSMTDHDHRGGTHLCHNATFDNRLSGKIPKNIGRLGKLEIFRVGGNQNLNGELPWEIGNCSNLVVLGVAETSIFGSIPLDRLVEEPSNNCNVHIFVVGSNTEKRLQIVS
ncbi:hypothetical protein Scep_019475 [Stephania cephalantha]|uniref:Uncharacterized protein n=1 Tax=Stephania cephalantha TaxID=152367 RepID=A0AAP0NPV3_9MAGN